MVLQGAALHDIKSRGPLNQTRGGSKSSGHSANIDSHCKVWSRVLPACRRGRADPLTSLWSADRGSDSHGRHGHVPEFVCRNLILMYIIVILSCYDSD